MVDALATADGRIHARLCAWAPPPWLRLWMLGATRLADGPGWPLLAVLLLAMGERGYHAIVGSAAAAALTGLLVVMLKPRFRRPRPCDLAPHPCFAAVTPPDRFSFPSGHAMNAFAVVAVLGLQFPSASPLLVFAAGSVAASRVVLGLHFVSDVVAGALLGLVVGVVAHAAVLP